MSNLLLVKNVRGHACIILFIYYEPWEVLDIAGACDFRAVIYGNRLVCILFKQGGFRGGWCGGSGCGTPESCQSNDRFLSKLSNIISRG